MAFRSESDREPTRQALAHEVMVAVEGTFVTDVTWVAETGSTNADLLELAEAGAAHGTVLVADHQVAGRGRRDRTWTTAPRDALLVSVLLRPRIDPDRLGSLTAATAVAAAEACSRSGAEGVAVKWPNDLVVGPPGRRRKLAGILAQSRIVDGETVVVVGMGLNVVSARLGPLAATAVALDELGVSVSRSRLLADVLIGLDALLADVEQGSDAPLWDRYRACSATIGTEVRAELDHGVIEGRAVGVTPTGALVVENETGRHDVVVGEVVSLR